MVIDFDTIFKGRHAKIKGSVKGETATCLGSVSVEQERHKYL